MHRTVATVIKVLGISIILMIIMDVTFIVVDTVTVHNRVNALSVVIQDELSRNNAIPEDIGDLFEEQLQDIIDKSDIAVDYIWNLDRDIVTHDDTYGPINEANVKDYGELLTVVILVKMRPHSLMYMKDTTTGGSHLEKTSFEYVSEFKYQVPALRYLK